MEDKMMCDNWGMYFAGEFELQQISTHGLLNHIEQAGLGHTELD